MNLPISNRLLTCGSFVPRGSRMADVGCDHAYLGIRLLTEGVVRSVIASDAREMPLRGAVRNAERFGVRDRMEFYLSDGVRRIPRDFDCMVCAGLGADTMIAILEDAPWLKDPRYTLILQCQSRRPELRQYLYAQGYRITAERLAQDGKFIYPVSRVVYDPAPPLTPGGYYLPPALLAGRDALLPAFYERVVKGLRTTVEGLPHSGGEKYRQYGEILAELEAMAPEVEARL